jgi:hypothetical protein
MEGRGFLITDVAGTLTFQVEYNTRGRRVSHPRRKIMPAQTIEELRDFHRFLGDRLAADGVELSPEQALDEWRRLHPPAHAADEDLAAIKEALADMANGDRGIPFAEFDRDFRKRHNLSA